MNKSQTTTTIINLQTLNYNVLKSLNVRAVSVLGFLALFVLAVSIPGVIRASNLLGSTLWLLGCSLVSGIVLSPIIYFAVTGIKR